MMANVQYKFPLCEYLRKSAYFRFFKIKKRVVPDAGVVGSKEKNNVVIIPDDPACIVEPFLFLGSAYAVRNTKVLEHYGITRVLNVARTIPVDPYNKKIITKHVLADDAIEYDMRQHFEECIQFIEEARLRGERVLVHCAMGVSRSATIIIAYLMYRYRMPFADAYLYTKLKRNEIRPNPSFKTQLRIFEYDLFYANYPRNTIAK